jgi:Kinesin motor domain
MLWLLLIKLQPALLQLFLADTNRVTSETPMNLASSRSHCLFTVTIEARQVDAQSCECVAAIECMSLLRGSTVCLHATSELCMCTSGR